jgi:hypothetical protein
MSVDCGECGTRAVAASVNSNDGQSDISGPLLLPPIIAMGSMTSDDHWYCVACSSCVVVDSTHSSDVMYDISRPLVLWSTTYARGYY